MRARGPVNYCSPPRNSQTYFFIHNVLNLHKMILYLPMTWSTHQDQPWINTQVEPVLLVQFNPATLGL